MIPSEIRTALHDEVSKILREVAASSPTHDLDTIAHRVVDALDGVIAREADKAAVSVTDTAFTDNDGPAPALPVNAEHDQSGGEGSGANDEHDDDAAHRALAADIAAGKVIEPPEGGIVEPVDHES